MAIQPVAEFLIHLAALACDKGDKLVFALQLMYLTQGEFMRLAHSHTMQVPGVPWWLWQLGSQQWRLHRCHLIMIQRLHILHGHSPKFFILV